jgi:hypothetical protein
MSAVWLTGVIAAALAACGSPSPPSPPAGSPEALAVYLQGVMAADLATRQHEVATWQLGVAAWDRTVIEPYRPLWADYQRAFVAEAPALVERLSHADPSHVRVRRHFAGDPRLTPAEARNRWALPVLFPSLVAEAGGPAGGPGGGAIDAVFVADGARWRALVGLDAVVLARVGALDAACAANLAHTGPPGRCTDVGAAIVEAALRTDRDRLAHVCALAETLCGKGSP